MNATELKGVLERHALWLADNTKGQRANLSGANLSDVILSCADLIGANLRCASLSGADLSGASLRYANLSGASLRRANLSRANLSGANLIGADLSGANLGGANLIDANLSRANLSDARLSCAALSCANLSSADLSNADLSGAKGLGQFVVVPPEGPVIGYKKAGPFILKLSIPADARRVNCIGSRKCRCDKATLVSVLDPDTGAEVTGQTRVASSYNPEFKYTLGVMAEEPAYHPCDRIECSYGIHFFITFQEAKEYV